MTSQVQSTSQTSSPDWFQLHHRFPSTHWLLQFQLVFQWPKQRLVSMKPNEISENSVPFESSIKSVIGTDRIWLNRLKSNRVNCRWRPPPLNKSAAFILKLHVTLPLNGDVRGPEPRRWRPWRHTATGSVHIHRSYWAATVFTSYSIRPTSPSRQPELLPFKDPRDAVYYGMRPWWTIALIYELRCDVYLSRFTSFRFKWELWR